MKLLEDIEFSFNLQEIINLLRGGNTTKQKVPTKKMMDEIKVLQMEALTLIKPKAMYNFFPSERLHPRHLFSLSEQTVLAICTISKELENYVTQMMDKGELTKGVILDAIASHAAEEVANEVNNLIIKENSQLFENNQHTNRFSPGYCRWGVEEGQKLIFSLLDAKLIDVRLSSSYMMIPRKSISFAINIGKKVEIGLGIKECSTCDLECKFRSD